MYYFKNEAQEKIQQEFRDVCLGNGEVVGVSKSSLKKGEYSILIRIPLANYPVVVGFKISNQFGDRLFEELGVSQMEDIVGREFECFKDTGKCLDVIAISPLRFDDEEFYRAA